MKVFYVVRMFRFVAAIAVIVSLGVVQIPQAQAAFSIGEDAFSISNAPGYCFAMAAFSRWYYLTHQGEPPLRKFLDKRTQQTIAKELQSFYSKNLITLQADFCNRFNGNQNESFKRFAEGLIKEEPRIVLLMSRGPRGAILHAVLAYGYLPDQNLVKIYDPNYLNDERLIDLERREYTSLDITYTAICFPEALQSNANLIRKMENLYASHVENKHPGVVMTNWSGAASGHAAGASKRERNSRGPSGN
jgi:hypothetical protein